MIIYVDIDETICKYENERSYSLASPIRKNVEVINELYDQGNKIVYWTARGSQSGVDYRELTEKQLNQWGAKHHELHLGKPHYDLFICDKVINSERFFNREKKVDE